MDKITNFEGVKKYFCTECKRFHVRKYKYKINEAGERIKSKDTPYFNHQEFAMKLTATELWKRQMKRSCETYTIKQHKKTTGSNKR